MKTSTLTLDLLQKMDAYWRAAYYLSVAQIYLLNNPLATSWQSNKFLDPIHDGAVLPILHLNGYKIANPTLLARIEPEELDQFLRGNGWTPSYVEGQEPALMHEAMAATLDQAVEEIKRLQRTWFSALNPPRVTSAKSPPWVQYNGWQSRQSRTDRFV